MRSQLQLLDINRPVASRSEPHAPLGHHLVKMGAIRPDQLLKALELQLRLGAPIGEILMAEGWITRQTLEAALAAQYSLSLVDLESIPPDTTLCRRLPAEFWLHHRVIPWQQPGDTVMIATCRPDRFELIRNRLSDVFIHVTPVLTGEHAIATAIAREFRTDLAIAASERVAQQYSCRTWKHRKRAVLLAMLTLTLAALIVAPVTMFTGLSLLAISSLVMFAILKTVAACAHLSQIGQQRRPLATATSEATFRLPHVSVLVPLFHEGEIIGDLLRRLELLTYPKVLLDVVLVLEEEDDTTRATLDKYSLPDWIRLIEVPAHDGLTTKPRAMNYALDFCHGEIIGVWDAEDAPESDQIEIAVAHFATVPPDVVCLQGVLDYYNPRTNWLARCFTIEYSAWFRIVLQGIARLGLVVPLGGTTLFFRRDVLEQLGGWDAHNVTEDADLGVRLCRAGYRTEMLQSTTYEEANCRPWPWVKQRSRWLKGFMVTYLVHMRNPARLLSDLGLWRFLGVQAFFIGTLSQFLLAPVLWSFWLILLGLPHPMKDTFSPALVATVSAMFIAVEGVSIVIGLISVSRRERRFLMPYVPTLVLYFPLGCIAAYKALYELLFRPFYWDKTQHGQAAPDTPPC
ncbi:glycosyltransferase [Pontibaca salina]|uniref:Glycosyltransferase n=1 Tax=Pontibaca salina TaxID=2795731 RepID=A0A934HTH0_9RHOB|nr:glycosyltransferase [Pontibaca salina]MBI6630546.1 glycosyltransferase [Pontibaca salina]